MLFSHNNSMSSPKPPAKKKQKEEAPEFYSVYKIVNIRKPEIVYSEKLVFVNIDLTREDLATEEDREYGKDRALGAVLDV